MGGAGAREASILARAPLAAAQVPGAFGLLALKLAGLGVLRGRRAAMSGGGRPTRHDRGLIGA
ncbi:MAG: hypothetical protein ACJA1L_001098 [Paracoccaceae bacterium]|jgi:hypothetical protein